MMRLLCDGQYLDLPSGVKMTFQKVNPLFAFDSISCERTTSFDLPKTPTNERVFSLSGNPAYNGVGMRKRFKAQFQDGLCVKDGYLYVETFNKTYKTIFVTGELVGLQAIRDLGSIKDIIGVDDYVLVGGTAVNANGERPNWGNVRHKVDGGGIIYPSMLLDYIIGQVVSQSQIADITIPSSAEGARVIPAKLNGLQKMVTKVTRAYLDRYSSSGLFPVVNTNTITADESISSVFGSKNRNVRYRYHFQDSDQSWRTTNFTGSAVHITPKHSMKITFPEDFPDDVYIGRFSGNGFTELAFEFFGEREFVANANGTYTRDGEPLAGRTISLERGQDFTFVKETDFTYGSEFATSVWLQGWQVNSALTIEGLIFDGEDIQEGDIIRLQDNLPDLTLTELLKVISAISGTALNYTDADGVTFDTLSFSTWPVIDLTGKVTEVGDLKRTFGDYAQVNTISFDHDDWVYRPLTAAYLIENVNLEAEKELVKIPFNEGNGLNEVYITHDEDAEKMTIARHSTGENLHRVGLPINAGLRSLCEASTSLSVKILLNHYEFERITPKTKILLNGVLYVWTDAKWSNGVAEYTLAKV